MAVPVNTSRRALLERGWYVVTDVETAFLGLSGKAHDLLIIIKHIQGEGDAAVPTQKRLAQILGWSTRTVGRVLDELANKRALTARRTGRASRYTVNHVLGTVQEVRVLLGSSLEIPADLVTADTTTAVGSDTTDSGASLLYKEPPRKNHQTQPLPSGGGDAAAPPSDPEDDMGINGFRPHGVIVDELNPADSLGLWEPQESDDSATDDLDGLFPAPETIPRSVARQKRARSQAQTDSAGSLAYEFEQLIRQQPWAGPAPVNKAALARNLSAWKRDGLAADQIRTMMQHYAADDFPRRAHKAPWIDFLGQRHKLLAASERSQQARSMEEHRHDTDDSYWLGSMAGGR